MRLRTFLLCSSLFIVSCADLRANPGDPVPLRIERGFEVWAAEPSPGTYGGPLSPFLWPDNSDLDLMAITLWGEARSQEDDEIRAIANVMVNRAERSRDGTLRSILLQPYQFSVWNKGDANYERVWNLRKNGCEINPRCLELRQIALDVLLERFYGVPNCDETRGAFFYHHGQVKPRWAKAHLFAGQIGHAKFYFTEGS